MDYNLSGRSRSKSPSRRYYGEDRRRGHYDDYYSERGKFGSERSRRHGGDYRDYHGDSYTDLRSRPNGRYQDRAPVRINRGEYGPKLDRTLDASYEEKVNRNYSNSIFIGNLTYDTTPEDLRHLFGKVGTIVRADIITSRGHHRGMGTVEYTNHEDVVEAIRRFNGVNFMQREIFVRQDNPPPFADRRERRAAVPTPRRSYHHSGFKINVANLPYSINWQALKDMFKECSEVIHADVSVYADGYSRGFGTVYVATKEDQIAAIKKWNGCEIGGRIIEVTSADINGSTFSRRDSYVAKNSVSGEESSDRGNYSYGNNSTAGNSHAPHSSTTKSAPISEAEFISKTAPGGEKNTIIYCENMPQATAESDLYDLFETIGKVVRAKLKYDTDGNPTGVSVCEFESAEDAEQCIERLDNYHYGGCDLKITYAKCNWN